VARFNTACIELQCFSSCSPCCREHATRSEKQRSGGACWTRHARALRGVARWEAAQSEQMDQHILLSASMSVQEKALGASVGRHLAWEAH
jgi:hypothetical protein